MPGGMDGCFLQFFNDAREDGIAKIKMGLEVMTATTESNSNCLGCGEFGRQTCSWLSFLVVAYGWTTPGIPLSYHKKLLTDFSRARPGLLFCGMTSKQCS